MRGIVYILLNLLVVALFLYSKLTPYKDKLSGAYLKIFTFFDKIFAPILNLLRKVAKPAQVGSGIAVDMSQIVLLVLLLLLFRL
ncbi:hypothetical protein FACS1894199_13690 [Bacteroidia bacterium]|nr:hypothetical protein FACS1894199_13690 [Bacteroidia bacterium]